MKEPNPNEQSNNALVITSLPRDEVMVIICKLRGFFSKTFIEELKNDPPLQPPSVPSWIRWRPTSITLNDDPTLLWVIPDLTKEGVPVIAFVESQEDSRAALEAGVDRTVLGEPSANSIREALNAFLAFQRSGSTHG